MIKADEELTPEEREAREKGLALVARLEQDEAFIRQVEEAFEQIAAGHFFIFDEDGWHD
jgi:adenosine/AMP kinase